MQHSILYETKLFFSDTFSNNHCFKFIRSLTLNRRWCKYTALLFDRYLQCSVNNLWWDPKCVVLLCRYVIRYCL